MTTAPMLPSNFADAWLNQRRAPVGSAIYDANEWALDAEIHWSFDEPHKLFEAIQLLSLRPMKKTEKEHFGTGPIEALFANFFAEYAQQMFRLAATNENISHALKGVRVNEEDEVEFDRMSQNL